MTTLADEIAKQARRRGIGGMLEYYAGPHVSQSARNLGQALQGGLEWLSPAGDIQDLVSSSRDISRGVMGGDPTQALSGALMATAAALGMALPGPSATKVKKTIKPFRVNEKTVGQFDPEFWDISEDILRGEGGEILRIRDRLTPKANMSFDVPAKKQKGVIYRGMSADEFADFKRTGKIKSKGEMNIGAGQEGLTYFADDPNSAASYANSFAPDKYKPTMEKPAYVVAVKKPSLDRIKDVPGVGSNEVGVVGAIPKGDVVGVYRGDVTRYVPEQNIYNDRGNRIFHSNADASVLWKDITGE